MSLRKQTIHGFVWTLTQQFGNQFINFLISLVLARVLLPEDFGLVGMIAIFSAIGNNLVDSGLSQSLIRSKEVDEEDFSTVFYFNFSISIFIYLIIYVCSPLISEFYNKDILTNLVRIYCLTFFISGLSVVPLAKLTRNLDFKMQTLFSIPSTILGGGVGIIMAYKGYGVWSLVWSSVCSSFLNSLQLWVYGKWKPILVFNKGKFKEHFGFGYKLTLSSLFNTLFKNIYLIVIGKFFTPSQVGFYTRAETMNQFPVNNISRTLNKVTFPLLSTIQDDNLRIKKAYRKLMMMLVYLIAPALIFTAVLAGPIFRFLFTAKWLPAVPYFQIMCVTGILYPLHSYNLNILKVKGRSDLVLKLSMIKFFGVAGAIFIGIQFGIYGLLYGQVIISGLFFFINTYYTDKFINYSPWEQIKDVIPILILAGVCGFFIYFIDIQFNLYFDIVRIIGGIMIGGISYTVLSYYLGIDSYKEVRKVLKL